MRTWYECKVKYIKIDENGNERKKTDQFLIDAVSFTDAETSIYDVMRELTSSEFQVMNIKKSNISEIANYDTGEWWYKSKINLVTIDEEKGREKKVNNYLLINADDTEQAQTRLKEHLSYILVPYSITGINLSQISDVFPYDADN